MVAMQSKMVVHNLFSPKVQGAARPVPGRSATASGHGRARRHANECSRSGPAATALVPAVNVGSTVRLRADGCEADDRRRGARPQGPPFRRHVRRRACASRSQLGLGVRASTAVAAVRLAGGQPSGLVARGGVGDADVGQHVAGAAARRGRPAGNRVARGDRLLALGSASPAGARRARRDIATADRHRRRGQAGDQRRCRRARRRSSATSSSVSVGRGSSSCSGVTWPTGQCCRGSRCRRCSRSSCRSWPRSGQPERSRGAPVVDALAARRRRHVACHALDGPGCLLGRAGLRARRRQRTAARPARGSAADPRRVAADRALVVRFGRCRGHRGRPFGLARRSPLLIRRTALRGVRRRRASPHRGTRSSSASYTPRRCYRPPRART